jgi:hypothetical protein
MTNFRSTPLALVLGGAIAATALPVRAQQNANQPGTTWSEEQLRRSVELARVGRRLTPKRWPDDARVAVCLSFDTDSEAPLLGQNGRMPSPALLYQLYKDEFDGAYEEGTLFVLTLHPYLSGHRAPMRHLDEFVAYMKAKPGVWFATGAQIAAYLKDAR